MTEMAFNASPLFRGDRGNFAGQFVDAAFSIGVQSRTEENKDQLFLRIDPQDGAGESSVSECGC